MTGKTAQSGEPPRWRDLLSVLAPLLALVSVLGFGVVHVSYERFYAQFGVVPEDVGANSTTILAQSGAHVVAYSVLFALVPYGLTLATLALAESALPAWKPRRLWVVVVALLPFGVYQELTGGGIVGGYMLVTAVALSLLAWWTGRANVRRWHAVLLWFSVGVFWLNLFYLPSAAARAGRCVAERGLALHAVHTRRKLPGKPRPAVLALTAQPAVVHWLGAANTRPSLGSHLLYLGEATGTAVLYDTDHHTTIRLPASQTAISTQTHPPTCPEFDKAVRQALS